MPPWSLCSLFPNDISNWFWSACGVRRLDTNQAICLLEDGCGGVDGTVHFHRTCSRRAGLGSAQYTLRDKRIALPRSPLFLIQRGLFSIRGGHGEGGGHRRRRRRITSGGLRDKRKTKNKKPGPQTKIQFPLHT